MGRFFFSILLTFSIVACGEFKSNYDTTDERQEEEEIPDSTFNTRLTNNLLIAGDRCVGGETVEEDGQIYTCLTDQWLVTVDNINLCNADGCTEVAVPQFIARLTPARVVSPPEQTFFFIVPISPISERVRGDLRRVWVRFDLNDLPRVIFRE